MKRNVLLFAVMIWVALGFTVGQAQDNGSPDTLYLEIWPGDGVQTAYPTDVRFNLRITNDIPDPNIDSIAFIQIALCFTSTNPAANCTIDPYYNNTDLYPFPTVTRSIFRHMPDNVTAMDSNFMMSYSETLMGWHWDTRILDLGDQHFWLCLSPTGTEDKRFPGGSRVLTATITFNIQDSTTICIDTCPWAVLPALVFNRSDSVTYIPQIWDDYIPAEWMCHSIQIGEQPITCGDATGDEVINVGDVVFLVSYLYKSGPAPVPECVGDVNHDGIINVGDIVYLVSYLYKGGPDPDPDCCAPSLAARSASAYSLLHGQAIKSEENAWKSARTSSWSGCWRHPDRRATKVQSRTSSVSMWGNLPIKCARTRMET